MKTWVAIALSLLVLVTAWWAWHLGRMSPAPPGEGVPLLETLFADAPGFKLAPQPEVATSRVYEEARHSDPAVVMELLPIASGDEVADIGAGTGFFTRRLAAAVGREGRVFATELDPMLLATILARADEDPRSRGLDNIQPRWVGYADVGLAGESVDLAFMAHLDFYARPGIEPGVKAHLRSVFDAVRPGGHIAVLQWLYWNIGYAEPEIDALSRQQVLDATVGNFQEAGFVRPQISRIPMPAGAQFDGMDPRVTLEMAFDTVLIVMEKPRQ